jgi:Phage integrase, N-terminal SAM-like domain
MLDEYVTETWWPAHTAHLAASTREVYAHVYDKHVAPSLGSIPLRELTPELIARWQTERIAASGGPEAVRKALTLLGGILQRAAEAQRIPSNPVRLVRKAKRPPTEEVRPLAPSTVDACGGSQRYLRRPPARARRGADAGHLRPRH